MPQQFFPKINEEDTGPETQVQTTDDFLQEINPFTGYLAKVFIKLKEKRSTE
jgi:hypothetical protein